MREPGHGALLYWSVFAAVSLAYLIEPRLDLRVSGLFYSASRGFYLGGEPWAHRLAVYVIPGLSWILGIGLVAALARVWGRRGTSGRRRRVVSYLAAAYALGPGLLTNVLLKDHWGRARPLHVTAFGGDRVFTTPLLPAHQCSTNCSFVSGHVSVPFFLMAFVFLIPDRHRRRWASVGVVAFGLLVGFERIVQGKHFLSDVLYSALFNTGLAWVLYRLIVRRRGVGPAVPPGVASP
ncbi:MAG: phosphatase PAP2 family protein [Candidatus Palauibacterales bacterium]|nr:phosphatase PAP2 family protein [Candidatus Palauibacterales bacterium]MDP2530804.1 phosphatase PAP2 family protein [Candidatus Palauibacterales bacterium]MDP2583122.1 phosphatase PAP2 family protein [Candidatus Palauibacterales bacterium]